MPGADVQVTRPALRFWVLAGLLFLIFMTGGSQRPDVASLQMLRPVSVLAAGYALFSMGGDQWRQHRHVVFLTAALVLLPVLHLVPLPPDIWHNLPGREVVRDIDELMGIANEWRPLTMVPSATWNALYSLAVPTAVFGLAAQQSSQDHVRLLFLIVVLAVLSGAVGLLQVIGANIEPYGENTVAGGLFANRNHQGVLLALLFPMLAVSAMLASAVGVRKRLGMIVAGAVAMIVVPLIIVTGSRGGLLAAGISIAFVPFLGHGRSPKQSRSRRDWLMLAGKLAVAVALLALLVWLTVFTSRGTAIDRLTGAEEDIRYPVWASIVDMLHVYMPWGSGIGSYADVYQILEPESLLRPTISNHAHNELLEIALTAGVPGLLLLAWAAILFLYAAWRAFRVEGRDGIVNRLGCVIILVLSFASALDYPVRTPIMASVLAIAAVWASSFGKFGFKNGRH